MQAFAEGLVELRANIQDVFPGDIAVAETSAGRPLGAPVVTPRGLLLRVVALTSGVPTNISDRFEQELGGVPGTVTLGRCRSRTCRRPCMACPQGRCCPRWPEAAC